MLKKLQLDLNQLTSQQLAREKVISELYMAFDELYEKKVRLQNPYLPKKNLFLSVRPEVLFQILDYLDLRTQLQLRLVNKDVNKVMHKVAQLKCQQLIKQVDNSVSELEELKLQESKQEIYPHLEQQLKDAQQNIINLDIRNVHELRAMSSPPVIIEKISFCLLVAFQPKFNEASSIWSQALRFLQQPQINQILIQLPAESISDQQLNKLELIDQITKEQARRTSIAAEKLYDLFKALIDLRRTQAYFTKHKISVIEKRIDATKFIIKKLQEGQ